MLCAGKKESNEVALVQSIYSVAPPDAGNDALGCVCLLSAPAESGENEANVDRLEGAINRVATGQLSEVIFFEIVLSTVFVARASFAVHPSTAELPWSRRQFYNTMFFEEPAMRRKRVYGLGNGS